MTEEPMFELPEEQPAPRSRRSQAQEEQLFVDQMMYMLTAPQIFHPPWDTLVEMHKQDVTLHRLINNKEILEKEMCSELEAMLYLSSASLEAPMRRDWMEIYFWLFNRWDAEKAKAAEIAMPNLDSTQIESMDRLRRWIFRTQMNHIKSKRPSITRRSAKEVEKAKQRLEIEQPSMFDLPDEETE